MFIKAITSEKSYTLNPARIYMFKVPTKTSKQAIKRAIEEQFHVTVTSLRVALRKGKATKYSRGKHAYPGTTYRQDQKIAYFTLKAGDSIKIFDEDKTSQADAADQTKAAKATRAKSSSANKKGGEA